MLTSPMPGIERLHAVIANPKSPDGAAVNASKFLVELAIGPAGLPGLAEPLPAGHTCDACGHQAPDAAGRSAAVERIKAQLEEVRGNLIGGEAVRELLSGEPVSVAE